MSLFSNLCSENKIQRKITPEIETPKGPHAVFGNAEFNDLMYGEVTASAASFRDESNFTTQTQEVDATNRGCMDFPLNDSNTIQEETHPKPNSEEQPYLQLSPTQGDSSNETIMYDSPQQTIDSPTDKIRSPYQLRELIPRYHAERFKTWTYSAEK